jgi:hypothetical protein
VSARRAFVDIPCLKVITMEISSRSLLSLSRIAILHKQHLLKQFSNLIGVPAHR